MSDNLLKRLESAKRWHRVTPVLTCGSISECDDAPFDAAILIRELEAELKEANEHLREIEKTYWIEGWSLSKRASWMKKLAEEYFDKIAARAAQEKDRND